MRGTSHGHSSSCLQAERRVAIGRRDMLTSAAVKAHARTLGFDVCGIAPATALPELAHLHDWLARGHAGEMSYLARTADVRADIQRFLPGARSVVVTGTNYWTGPAPRAHGVAPARVARYAHGEDYHVVLAERLEALLGWMRQQTARAVRGRAVRGQALGAGARVRGAMPASAGSASTRSLINPELGSWLLLGGLATTLPLAPDALVADQCGACTLCLDACPTGAIVAPRDVDARACLSYLTIELDGPVPDASKATGRRSPLRLRRVSGRLPVEPRAGGHRAMPRGSRAPAATRADAAELWQRPDDALHEFVAGSAMTHAPLAQLRRNLALVIGNAPDAAAREVCRGPAAA